MENLDENLNSSIQILVVDDYKENLKVVSNHLKEHGYKIALALDGETALKIVAETRIDLILLDIMMPGIDGFEVCQRLKSNPKTEEIPIIFLTAKNDTDDIVKGFQVGGVDYITKPFRKEELYARVQNHIKLKLFRDWYKIQAEESRNKKYDFLRSLHDLGSLMG